MYEAVNERIMQFYLEANEIFYKAAKGRVHAVLIGKRYGQPGQSSFSPPI